MADISIQLPSKYEDATIVAKIKNSDGEVEQTIDLDNKGDSFFAENITEELNAGTYAIVFVDTTSDQIVGIGELYWDGNNEITLQGLDLIRKALLNNMRVDSDNNQLVIFDNDGETELLRFNLFDDEGEPTNNNIFGIENA